MVLLHNALTVCGQRSTVNEKKSPTLVGLYFLIVIIISTPVAVVSAAAAFVKAAAAFLETAAAAIAEASLLEATATAAFRLRTAFIHHDVAAINFRAVQRSDRSLCL